MTNEKYLVKNNFFKISYIESILMVGEESNEDVFLSFFIPTYNRIETLKETVNSVLSLKNLDSIKYEIIVTDNTADFTDSNKTYIYFKELSNPKIKYYINKDNIGLFNNWNKGIELAKGIYFAMIHDDDLLHVNYLIGILKCIGVADKRGELGFIHTNKATFYSSNDLPKVDFKNRGGLLEYKLIDSVFTGVGPTCAPTCGTIFLRESLLDVGGYDDFLSPTADQIIGFLIMEKGYKGYLTEDILGYYRIGLNESLKPTTMKDIIKKDYYISNNYMYKSTFLSKCFGLIFSNIQYSSRIDLWVKLAHNKYKVSISKEDLDYRGSYHKSKIGKLCMKVIIIFNFKMRKRRLTEEDVK